MLLFIGLVVLVMLVSKVFGWLAGLAVCGVAVAAFVAMDKFDDWRFRDDR